MSTILAIYAGIGAGYFINEWSSGLLDRPALLGFGTRCLILCWCVVLWPVVVYDDRKGT